MSETLSASPANEVLRLEQVRKAFNIGTPLETEV
ncbi:MAG TPA: ABC transporter ATP-binding protein, partial [Pseudomonas sp.]|nr:ABC transporter ATP-binding protein [Pseudomonas sp.]